MPRFVILQHDHPEALHWDVCLEVGDTLATWSVPLPPNPRHVTSARRLADHRREYLDYEGPVSGDRGLVAAWDRGDYDAIASTDDRVEARLRGGKIEGTFLLQRVDESTAQWTLTYLPHFRAQNMFRNSNLSCERLH